MRRSRRFVALAFCWADTLIELDSDDAIVFAAGLTISVTGLGGFRILTSLDIDLVKFNRDTAAIAKDTGKSRALLVSLTGFCRMLDIQTIATAVEATECLHSPRVCGVGCVQGYLLGKPSPDIETFQSPPTASRNAGAHGACPPPRADRARHIAPDHRSGGG